MFLLSKNVFKANKIAIPFLLYHIKKQIANVLLLFFQN
ncbi:hypothetical protein QN326_06410 [Candidatus Phytoplasma asteris]|uniref:Uncharacterized protein n=1 Tax=Candidatus Phytoplasma asteris TaxID=85620 RepID=A0ABZ3CDF4_9MOLU